MHVDEREQPATIYRGLSKNRGGFFRWVLGIAVLTAAVAAAYGVHRWTAQPGASEGKGPSGSGPQQKHAVPVAVATAKKGDLPIYLERIGTATALNTVTVRTRVDGQITAVNYTEGQMVKEGDVLVQIDPRPFQVALDQAQADAGRARAAADQTRAALAKDQAQARNAKAILDRDATLLAKGFVSKEEYDASLSQSQSFEATVKADYANIKSAEDTVRSADATIAGAQLQLTYSKITAPITGRIGLRLVDVGNMVHAGNATGLVVITQIEPITVVFSILQENLPLVLSASGKNEALPVEVDDRNKNKIAEGRLLAVDSQIDLSTRSAQAKATFDNKDHALFPNQGVNVRMLVETRKDVVLIPITALQRSPDADYVYIVKPDNTVELRTVTRGPSEGDVVAVEKNLSAGEIVVTEGVDKLEPGTE